MAFLICSLACLYQLPFSVTCNELRKDTVRLHVVANSDFEEDQEVKLCVRDAILEQTDNTLFDASSRADVLADIEQNLDAFEEIAKEVLRKKGFDYGARAYVVDMFFDQRSYGGITMPAGEYTALRIELGEASGKNWWCVLYPSLCVPSVSRREIETALGGDETQLLMEDTKYEIRFKIEELFQNLFNR